MRRKKELSPEEVEIAIATKTKPIKLETLSNDEAVERFIANYEAEMWECEESEKVRETTDNAPVFG